MPTFRTVNGGRAGPTAVGILVPPGGRTVVVIRPRALSVDLVMVRRTADGQVGEGFFEAARQAAGVEAQRLSNALLQGDAGRVMVVPAAAVNGFHVHADVGPFSLIACLRNPGQAYRPHVYPTSEEAKKIAEAVQAILCPGPDANQELYTNLSQFDRRASPVSSWREGWGSGQTTPDNRGPRSESEG